MKRLKIALKYTPCDLPVELICKITLFLSSPKDVFSLLKVNKWISKGLKVSQSSSCDNVIFKINAKVVKRVLSSPEKAVYNYVKRIMIGESTFDRGEFSFGELKNTMLSFPELHSISIKGLPFKTSDDVSKCYSFLEDGLKNCLKSLHFVDIMSLNHQFLLKTQKFENIIDVSLVMSAKMFDDSRFLQVGHPPCTVFPFECIKHMKSLRVLNLLVQHENELFGFDWGKLVFPESMKTMTIRSHYGTDEIYPLVFPNAAVEFLRKLSEEQIKYGICQCRKLRSFEDLQWSISEEDRTKSFVRCDFGKCAIFEKIYEKWKQLVFQVETDEGRVRFIAKRRTSFASVARAIEKQTGTCSGSVYVHHDGGRGDGSLIDSGVWYNDLLYAMGVQYGGKPVILLYPNQTDVSHVTVRMELNLEYWQYSTYYPKIEGVDCSNLGEKKVLEWKLDEVKSDGMMEIEKNRYPSLFWEAVCNKNRFFIFEKDRPVYGIHRNEIGNFLYDALKAKGMKEKDSYDLVTYWIKELEMKEFVVLQFMSKSKYEKVAKLSVEPKSLFPQHFLYFIVFYPIEKLDGLEDLLTDVDAMKEFREDVDPEKGVLVEWGGMKLVCNPFVKKSADPIEISL